MAPQPLLRPAVAHALRVAGWNAAALLGALALIAIAGEVYLRADAPFAESSSPSRFVPGVGVLYEPHAEVRSTDGRDYWTTQRANSLGFLDREPPAPDRAAASCHVAVVGGSFVEAREVAIADKLQVRLEAIAAREAPELDVTASAWGRRFAGQAAQLAFHDAYARLLAPDLLALVVAAGDFPGNSPATAALRWGWDPGGAPYALPARGEDGAVRLRPPDPRYAENALPWFRPPAPLPAPGPWYEEAAGAVAGRSLFLRWLDGKRRALAGDDPGALPPLAARAEALAARPGYGWVLGGWEPDALPLAEGLLADDPPPVFAEALEFTAWALAGFRSRADAGGAAIVVLAAHEDGRDGRALAVLRGMAEPLGIPVLGQREWIASRGGRAGDAEWPDDHHWTPQGHQWAAEALLGWLRRHPEVCDDRARRD